MQIHPFLATVTRPVYWDRFGSLYLQVKCPECNGHGDYEGCDRNPIDPSGRTVWCRCDECKGEGTVFEQADEDDLQS